MRKKHLSWRKESRDNYGSWVDEKETTVCEQQVRTGAILRIADSLETLINRKLHEQPEYKAAIADRDKYLGWYQSERNTVRKMGKTIDGLRGYITRLKNRYSAR